MIKFDLHIHSSESAYKEDSEIVLDSTVENIDTLLKNLNDNKVALFSITDHNRFNVSLYEAIDKKLLSSKSKYSEVKNLVAGVEFDVKFDDEMGKCHVICIFDANNESKNYQKIKNAIDKNLLTTANQYYTRNEFESILKEIGLNVILIACQRSSLTRQDGNHNSLSESSKDPLQLLTSGYISALEFQKPNVEGILKNNLKNMNVNSSLVIGSDCHEWSAYPKHDSKSSSSTLFHHSMAKIMPTFKGLLLAFTSPKTRFDVNENTNANYIKSFSILGQEVPLTNGINAIIGENGAGKSSILKILNGDTSQKYVKKIKTDNSIECNSISVDHINYIGQGDIAERYINNSLFDDSNYGNVNNEQFRSEYTKFSESLYNYIRANIECNNAVDSLKSRRLEFFEVSNGGYYIDIKPFSSVRDSKNIHREKLDELTDTINKVLQLINDEYYINYRDVLKESLDSLVSIWKAILAKSNSIKKRQFVRNNIESGITKYEAKVKEASSSFDQRISANRDKRRTFIDSIVQAMALSARQNIYPKKPPIMNGESKRSKHGFSFNTETKYNKRSVIEDFYERMFDKDYQDENSLKKISSQEEFMKAVRQCNDVKTIKETYNKNYSNFEEQMTAPRQYFTDGSSKSLGNTLGEMSLAYFKFTSQNDSHDILLMDQPEDNISNHNISEELISYLNSIRTNKQLIIVTHNPLLVVNQDVDNVVFLSKNNDKIYVRSGPLEYENNEYAMLDIIAKHMDGGAESIRKRLKVYE